MTALAVDVSHGTRAGYLAERNANIPACTACRAASEAYLDAHRPENGSLRNDLTSAIRPPVATLSPDQAARAECAQHSNKDLWFSEVKGHGERCRCDDCLNVAEARMICGACPIRQLCLAIALANEEGRSVKSRFGIYGGMSPQQRGQLARKAAA